MKKVILTCVFATALAGCALDPSDRAEGPEQTAASSQAVVGIGPVFPVTLSGPNLVQWTVRDDGASNAVRTDFGVRLETKGRGVVRIRLSGCSLDTVRRAFDLMRSTPKAESVAWDYSVPCPGDAIPESSKLFVEPIQEGYSYLELPDRDDGGAASGGDGTLASGAGESDAGTTAPVAETSTYLVIPNQCANLVSHFSITERAAKLPAGSTELDLKELASSNLVPLDCGQERLAASSVPTLGVVRFGTFSAKGRAVVLRYLDEGRGDIDIFFAAIDGQPVDKWWQDGDGRGLLEKLRSFGRLIGAIVPTQAVNGESRLVEERRSVPTKSEAWDLRLDEGVRLKSEPSHRWWDERGKLVCLSGEPPASADGSCNDQLEVVEAHSSEGERNLRLEVRGAGGRRTAIALPSCSSEDEWPNWRSLLDLGAGNSNASTWLQSMESGYLKSAVDDVRGRLPCLVNRTCRVRVAKGTNLSQTAMVRASLNAKSVLAGCASQCTGTCKDVVVSVLGDVAIGGGGPFAIDASKLPEGVRSVRVEGLQSNTTIRVAEAAANTPNGKFSANRPLPALAVSGQVDVTFANLRLVAAAESNQLRRTDAPAIARVAVDVSGNAGSRSTLRLIGVSVDGGVSSNGASVPFYEGLRAKSALIQLLGTQIYAYKRAVGVEDTDLSVIGAATASSAIHSCVLKDSSAPLLSMVFTSAGVGRSLAGTVENFPALELGARSRAFIANVDVKGPLGVAWVGASDGEPNEERAVFYDTSIGGPGNAGPISLARDAIGLSVSGSGTLRLVKPTISNTYMPIECAETMSSDVPRLKLIQQSYSCIGTERSDMIGDGMCVIEQNEDWVKNEAWPGCVES